MSKRDTLLSKIEDGKASWKELQYLINLTAEKFEPFLELAHEVKKTNIGNELKIYIPDKRFPAVSLTGEKCALHCEHCDVKYLKGMKSILTNQELESFLIDLKNNEGVGVLLSGGCEEDGSVPILKYLDVVKKLKQETNLVINTHTGLLNEETAQKLAEARVDIISFDVNLDEEILHDIYHLDKNVEDYENALDLLLKYGLNVVPHVCVGLNHGKINKELNSLRIIKEKLKNPELIVLIALIPPKDKEDMFKSPEPLDIAKIVAVTRFLFPKTEISLGCMRPRKTKRIEIETLAIQAGISRIEIPTIKTIRWLKENHPDVRLKYFSACCALPTEHEAKAKSNPSDIKRYLRV